MSLGSGFAYLMGSVARGDGAALSPTTTAGSTSLTRYYAESGTPPGRFLGAGLAGLAEGRGVAAGTVVSEEALWRLLGMMADPVTGEPLGRRPGQWPAPLAQRVGDRVAVLPAGLSATDRSGRVSEIEAEEARREASLSRPVAAFDLTFSVPKSVSVLWALADPATQAVVYRAHQDAVQITLEWAERNVVFTRTGAGGVVQEPVRGVVAAAFDHWDSRAGDPHLHTHVVVTNRVQSADGVWRSVDSTTLFRYTVALSELHEGVVQDLLADRLGVTWQAHPRVHSPVPRWDIAGVPVSLVEEFSTRSQAITAAKDDLAGDFAARHGRQPTTVEVLKLRQQATLSTRPAKEHVPLAERITSWRRRARDRTGRDPTDALRPALNREPVAPVTGAALTDAMLADLATLALDTVAQKRATFGHANVLAEVHRQLHGLHFATPLDRIDVAHRAARLALAAALPLDPPPLEPVPEHLARADGTSKLRHRGADRYTTTTILDAETRLLDAARDLTAPTATPSIDSPAAAGEGLGADQAAAVHAIATSGRTVDLLVGPAGAGKTTSLSALRTVWEDAFGAGSVTGLAPSAAAAQVLGDELGIATDTTAKWLLEHTRTPERATRCGQLQRDLAACGSPGSTRALRLAQELLEAQRELDRWTVRPGQLLIIDEASLAGTLTLDSIATAARATNAKVLLVGDWAQLGAIDAGGAFHMLATDRPDTPELTTVRRFTQPWEAAASLRLRTGDLAAVDDYLDHGRIHAADRITVLHQLFDAWHADIAAGIDSIMIATDDTTVRDLNALAHAAAHDAAQDTTPRAGGQRTVRTADGFDATIGDRIVTRRNDRRLTTPVGAQRTWVKNGDTWTITATHRDGSITASTTHNRTVRLPADYVTAHVELGYATTIHRTQGRTHQRAHALLGATTTREGLYVATTRARARNDLYVVTDDVVDHDTAHDEPDTVTAPHALGAMLANSATATSAHAALAGTARTRQHQQPRRTPRLEHVVGVPEL